MGALEREVKEMARKSPIPPEQRANMAAAREARAGEKPDYLTVRRGNADYGGPVQRDLARLRGRSTSEVVSDRERGASSPLERRRK